MDFFLSPYYCFPLIKLCLTAYKKVDLKKVMDRTLQYCCLENPMDGGAWWAAVHGVA